MENLINKKYYKNTKKLILDHIDELNQDQLSVLYYQLTLENAKETYDKVITLFPDDTINQLCDKMIASIDIHKEEFLIPQILFLLFLLILVFLLYIQLLSLT